MRGIGDSEIRDGLLTGSVRGRGAGLNPGNRFEDVRLHVLGDHLDEVIAETPDGRQVTTHVFRDRSHTILNPVDSPDLSMKWTVNPYRGCEHGCIYCYARPGHEYLGLSCGLDFETKIMAKPDAPLLLRQGLAKASWMGETISFSGVTDCYQPLEAKLRITRACIEVCAEFAQPFFIITKNRLVTRDIDVLQDLAKHNACGVAVSITTLDNALASKMEPRASSPRERLETIRTLTNAGIPTMVMAAPMIPALNENELPRILKAARDAGAQDAGYVLLRLPYQIKDLFLDWLKREYPERAAHVEAALRDTRDGALYQSAHGERMKGSGPRAEQIGSIFRLFKRRYNLERFKEGLSTAEFFRRKQERNTGGQLGLFATE